MIKRNWPWLLALVLLFLFVRNNSFSFVLGLLLIGVVLVLWGLFGSRRKKGKQEEIPALTDELETHYEKSGMTANEISFFRQTMNQTKNEINQLQMNMQQTAKLKAIDLRHDPVKAA
ncbi:5-bromo-4-chloroindolyl phosphate hydrolysis family protein, partial [Enterococcus faecium]